MKWPLRTVTGIVTSWAVMATPTAAQVRTADRTAAQPPQSDTVRGVHLLNRATFGYRPEDLARVLADGESAWLERQLYPDAIADAELGTRLARFPAAHASMPELYRDFPPLPRPDAARGEPLSGAERRARARRSPVRILGDLIGARLVRAVHSERQLEEVMTDFWFNHFNVFWGKGADRYLIGDYERTAIRPHVFGRFEDMLRATARHPAMLFYLDNWTSAVPDPEAERLEQSRRRNLARRLRSMSPGQKQRLARQRGVTVEQLDLAANADRPLRARGINENYAREILELHTLGVDGGYTQEDVVNVARAFTGWTMTPPGPSASSTMAGGEVRFLFRPAAHDRGEKSVLGRTLPAGRGVEDGEDVIALLAAHPATARHIATKLVERFVSDRANPRLVDELARVFAETNGDLRAVTRSLFTSELFHGESHHGSKVKSPFLLIASALRVTGVEAGPSRRIVDTLRGLGQVPYLEPAPTGYPAVSEDWVNSGSMLARMNFAIALAGGRLEGIRIGGLRLRRAGSGRVRGDAWLPAMVRSILPATSHDALLAGIRADFEEQAGTGATRRTLAARAVALTLGSPEFQRH